MINESPQRSLTGKVCPRANVPQRQRKYDEVRRKTFKIRTGDLDRLSDDEVTFDEVTLETEVMHLEYLAAQDPS